LTDRPPGDDNLGQRHWRKPIVEAQPGISCLSCGHANRPDRRFCTECGRRLGRACVACGSTTEVEEKFCGNCGAPPGERAAARAPEVEKELGLAQARDLPRQPDGRQKIRSPARPQTRPEGPTRFLELQAVLLARLRDLLNHRPVVTPVGRRERDEPWSREATVRRLLQARHGTSATMREDAFCPPVA
jgi:double zinc ribbon protein